MNDLNDDLYIAMNNDELAEAIAFAEKASTTTVFNKEVWQAHLKELLAVQLNRALFVSGDFPIYENPEGKHIRGHK